MFGQAGTQAPSIEVQWFAQSVFSVPNFFNSILYVKIAEVEVNYWIVIQKWYYRRLRLLTMLLPGRIYIALGPWHFGDFRKIFLPNIGEDKKKILSIWARGPGTVP